MCINCYVSYHLTCLPQCFGQPGMSACFVYMNYKHSVIEHNSIVTLVIQMKTKAMAVLILNASLTQKARSAKQNQQAHRLSPADTCC